MMDVMTAVAQVLAQENGATLQVNQGFACSPALPLLGVIGSELADRMEPVGIALLDLRLEGETLIATIDESEAEEPLCPNAFHRVVRELTYRLCGQVWETRIEEATAPALVPAA